MHRLVVEGLPVDVLRKAIKRTYIRVYPPDGRVRVSAPLRVDDEAVRLAVVSKLKWILRQQARFRGQERQGARDYIPLEYVSRESHYFQGQRYLLNVINEDAPPRAVLRSGRRMDLVVRPGSDRAKRERVLLEWYRARLKEAIPPIIAKWEPVIGVRVVEWRVKRMRTRWGTCNIRARRIWLNLELAKWSEQCLEFIIVHEMVHLLERKHNEVFKGHMDRFLPQWRLLRDELNRGPLDGGRWQY